MERNDALAAERVAMLRDIEHELAFSCREVGKNAFDPRVVTAIAKVPREQFVPESHRFFAFKNGPLPIGHGQTISQPYIVALMSDLVQPQPGGAILEIGTGSGYQAAVLAGLVRHVYSIEIVAPLALAARERLAALGYDNVTVRQADGYHGWPEHAPYNGIVVTAATPEVPPALIEQLGVGARLVIPLGWPGDIQVLTLIEKLADGNCRSQSILPVAFVPLTRA